MDRDHGSGDRDHLWIGVTGAVGVIRESAPSMGKLKAGEATEPTTLPVTTCAVDGKPAKGAKK
jgi:hypothetical protein